MTDMRAVAFTQQWLAMREALKAEFPDLDIDTMQDTLEGETGVLGLVAKMVEEAIFADGLADGLDSVLKAVSDRRTRLQAKSERLRGSILTILQAIEYQGALRLPIATVSTVRRPPSPIVDDPTKLPDHLMRIVTTKTPDKAKIAEAMKNSPVEGCRMSNGSVSLTIRIK